MNHSRMSQLLLVGCLGSSLALASDVRVSLPERASVNGPRILLGDIARIDSPNPELTKRLTNVLVGLAPLPGASRTLARGEIVQALALAGFAPGEVTFGGAGSVELHRTSQRIADQRVSALLRTELGARLNIPANDIALASLRFVDPPQVGGGAIELRVHDLAPVALNTPLRATILVSLDGVPSMQLEAEVVASLRSSLPASTPVSNRRRPRKARLVRSGQPVQIALEGPGMRISAVGKARGSGGLGDEVAVENVISGTVIRCVITGNGQVQVQWSPVSGLREVSVQ